MELQCVKTDELSSHLDLLIGFHPTELLNINHVDGSKVSKLGQSSR